ncbi:MAG TPA: DUF5317 family protein, partial [Acidimicrobiia bacterium]|nr:DUF5317 family protein [Acidimicrobiia bacterium]
MELIAVAVGAGVVFSVVTGGSVARVLDVPVRWSPLLAGAFALQVLLGVWHPGGGWPRPVGLGLYLVSFVLLAAFCARNLRLVGMSVVLVGVLMNLVAIAANGGMPVRLPADADAAARGRLDASVTHVPEDDAGPLRALGDIIVVGAPVDRAISFGDLVLAVGLVDVIYRASRRPRRRRGRAEAAAGAGGSAAGGVHAAPAEDEPMPAVEPPVARSHGRRDDVGGDNPL